MKCPNLINVLLLNVALLPCVSLRADEHSHAHHQSAPVERPKVFLDKSPRVVEYQLRRLDNARLLLVERATTDLKYSPVYQAILLRPGMSRQQREESLQSLLILKQSNGVTELLTALQSLDPKDREQQKVGRQLSDLLLDQPADQLVAATDALSRAAMSSSSLVSAAGMAGLTLAGDSSSAWQIASASPAAAEAWLESILLLPSADLKLQLRPNAIELLESNVSRSVTEAVLRVLSEIPTDHSNSFKRIAPFASDGTFRETAVRSLLRIPDEARDPAVSGELVRMLVDLAESTPASERTTEAFIDAMQLAEQLLSKLNPVEAMELRQRLREVAVQAVRIRTVHEEMRYDIPYFAVEAGRSVQIILYNDDLMPHNLVITRPGALREVTEAGSELGNNPGFQNLPYVPMSEQVLFASEMVEAGRQQRLTFTAPSIPGEYPYVCTFPRHWMRMYGVMVVVEDIDVWQRTPVAPTDPLGNTRPFVRNWTLADFDEELARTDRGRASSSQSSEIGARLFREATCQQCHRIGNEGGTVGPEMNGLLTRWKGDYRAILREILDPSYRIDAKFAMHTVVTKDGKSLSGIVRSEDDRTISLLTNPESPAAVIISRSQIDEMVVSSTSMMPRALLDKFTHQEIREILSFITSVGNDAAEPLD